VLIHGARQVGKSTLAQAIVAGRRGASYLTLDDSATYAAAAADPQGFVESFSPDHLIVLDEVQRLPDLLVAIKLSIDQQRRPGRFLLTGSANVMLLPHVAEALAGRVAILELRPLAQAELEGTSPELLGALFEPGAFVGGRSHESQEQLLERALGGGYPEARARDGDRRAEWFGSYLTTVVQRETRSFAAIDDLSRLSRILGFVATRTGEPRNIEGLSRDTGIAASTIKRHLAILQAVFLVDESRPWWRNVDARIMKSPKLLMNDSGLFAYLTGARAVREMKGPLFETFIGAELHKLLSWSPRRYELLHFRTQRGKETDFVIEAPDGRIVGIEVKASVTVKASDFDGLAELRELAGADFVRGIVLHAGRETLPFGDRLFSLPMSALWRDTQ